MRRVIFLLALVMFSCSGLFAQGVDRDELSDILERTINFRNYTGRYDRIDSLAAIRAIGQGLARGITRDQSSVSTVGEKYRIHHILGTPEELGKPADILELLPAAGVDHIDNVRRIISAYLETAYGYSTQDARTLSIFITVYNAVHRGTLKFFTDRYKASVMKIIRPEAAGLGLSYTDWPGKTQIFIPLSRQLDSVAATASVSASDLVSPEVIETIRDKVDQGIEERKDLAKLIDKGIEAEEDKLAADKAALAVKEAELATKQAELAKTGPSTVESTEKAETKPAVENATRDTAKTADSTTATKPANNDTATQASKAATTVEDNKKPAAETTPEAIKVAEETKAIEAEKAAIADREKAVAEAATASSDLRESTAADIKNQDNPSAQSTVPQIFPKARIELGMVVSTLQRVDPVSSEVLKEAVGLTMVGKSFMNVGENILVLSWKAPAARLTLIEKENLTLFKQGTDILSPYGDVVYLEGKGIYGVVSIDGVFYVGKFNTDLVLEKRSVLPVDSATALKVLDQVMYVQRTDGRMSGLSIVDLSSVK